MTRYLTRLVGALAVIGLMIGPIGVNYAQELLPAEIQSVLAEAAAESDEALLEAVAAAVEQNPELAQAIVDEATGLSPELAEAIVATATEAGGAVEIVPAAGPATPILIVLAGVGAAGGGTAAALAGGGGGGGGGVAPPPPPPPEAPPIPPPPEGPFVTPEFNAQEGLALVNASLAYDRGFTGQGVVVAVLDTGLDVTHPEFAGRIAPGGFDFVLDTPDMTDPNGHGTFVSGIIAANKDDVGMHGVAFNSQLLPIRIFDANGNFAVTEVELAAAIDRAVVNDAAVINNSWGTGIDITAVTRQEIIDNFVPTVVLDAVQRAFDNSTIIVFAAGNSTFANPSIEAGLPFHFPEFQELWVAAVSVDLDGNLSSFSNQCGVAAAWCIAAPGGNIFSTVPGGTYARASGTSFAAPHVSGALAILL